MLGVQQQQQQDFIVVGALVIDPGLKAPAAFMHALSSYPFALTSTGMANET